MGCGESDMLAQEPDRNF